LQLEDEVSLPVHKGGQSYCCFHQGLAVLPFSCNSIWSAPPPARWGNSVLNTALVPQYQLQDPPSAPLWEVGLLPHPCSQPLCLSRPLLCASSSCGRLTCHPILPPPCSAFVSFPTSAGCQWLLWEVGLSLYSSEFATLPAFFH
jgi:hypothetical protein